YTRPPSLVSVWSTAPFLLNNSVGTFYYSPSVASRMDSFQTSIEQLLWPEKREKDSRLGDKVPGVIDRITERCYLRIAPGYIPENLRPLVGGGQRLFPKLLGRGPMEQRGGIEIGPIPPGTAVGLLSNLNVLADDSDLLGRIDHDKKLLELALKIKH